jgi:hypothetical protein
MSGNPAHEATTERVRFGVGEIKLAYGLVGVSESDRDGGASPVGDYLPERSETRTVFLLDSALTGRDRRNGMRSNPECEASR